MRPLLATAFRAASVLALLLGPACAPQDGPGPPEIRELATPAGPGSALPHTAEAGGGAILSWVEPRDDGHALRFSRFDGSEWSEPLDVAHGSDWFVNWADFPSVIALSGSDLAAHWLKRSASRTYAYDVMISRSTDGGRTWSEPVRPHSDGTPTEHGFVSLFPAGDALGVVWLDGRKYAEAGGEAPTNEMTVRFATLFGSAADGAVEEVPGGASVNAGGSNVQEGGTAHGGSGSEQAIAAMTSEVVLDERACDCCQTAIAMTAVGPFVAYRDRTEDEVRDISVTRLIDGEWTPPATLHEDQWKIDACPVNGPQADARGGNVAVAWFTAARDTPLVRVAFSHDAGATFATPIRIDEGDPLGRVDVLFLDDTRALVLWLERTAAGAGVRARIVTSDGNVGEAATIAETTAQRPTGFPRMARYDGGVLLAWTEPGDTSRVRAATLDTSRRQ